MRKKTNRYKPFLIILCLFLSACTATAPDISVLEEIAPSILYFFDEGEEKKLRVTSMVPPVRNETRVALTSEEDLIKELKKSLNSQYYREIKDGQLRIAFFSQNIAKRGVKDIVDSLYLDTELSDRVFLGVIEGDFEGFLKSQRNQYIDLQLYRQMKHNRIVNITYVRDLHQYLKASYNPYADPIVPYYTVRDNEAIIYNGLVLFKNHVLVGIISLDEEKYFRLLHREIIYYEEFPLDSLQISLSMVEAKKKFTIDPAKKNLKVEIDISCHVNEYQGDLNLSIPSEQKALKNTLEKHLQDNSYELLKKLQDAEVDPLGIGKDSKKMIGYQIKENEWNKMWSDLNIEVDYHIQIKDYGTYTTDSE